jgi:hypothetical protein
MLKKKRRGDVVVVVVKGRSGHENRGGGRESVRVREWGINKVKPCTWRRKEEEEEKDPPWWW